MIKAIIFDCFGVIITDALLVLTNELAVRDPAAARLVSNIIKANNCGSIPPEESNLQIADLLGLSLDEFQHRKYSGEVKDQSVLDFIAGLRPQYKTAMLSNVGCGSLSRRFTVQELGRCFDVVIASGEIGYAKPDPEAYQITAARLAVATEECIFTDDREHFCAAARATGMQAIHYRGFSQFCDDLSKLL